MACGIGIHSPTPRTSGVGLRCIRQRRIGRLRNKIEPEARWMNVGSMECCLMEEESSRRRVDGTILDDEPKATVRSSGAENRWDSTAVKW